MNDAGLIKKEVLGVHVAALTVEQFISTMIKWAKEDTKRFGSYVNAHCLELYHKDSGYREVIDKADMVYADGQAIVWASQILGAGLPERVNAGDFFIEFCFRCAAENLRLFFLGSKENIARKAAENIKRIVPDLDIAGTHHGYFEWGHDKDEKASLSQSLSGSPQVIQAINDAIPDILIVGMSAPRQEKWACANLEALDVNLVWCVGALFEYYAGVTPRAPVWMRRVGLEWAFRLAVEPRRLLKRYTIENVQFLVRLFKALLIRK